MIFDMVIYVTLINLTPMECIRLLLKSCLFLCLCVKEPLTFEKTPDISWSYKLKKIFIANVNVYTCSNLIKTDKYFRTKCCLVINLKQNRF